VLVHVVVIDTPEAESFSVAPERIYITRKMVALLRNDDELAGLLGHELGHILAHQNAIIVSQLFREILGVNVVSDRKDISDKLISMFNSIDRDYEVVEKSCSNHRPAGRDPESGRLRVAVCLGRGWLFAANVCGTF